MHERDGGRAARETVRTRRLWELYFAIVLVGVILLVLVPDNATTASRRLTCVGLLLTMAAWYLALGRRAIAAPRPSWRGYVFQAGLLAVFASAYVLVNASSFLLVALCPLAYMTLKMNAGHAAMSAFAFSPAAVQVAVTGDLGVLRVLVPLGAIVVSISAAVAITIDRAERQSAERAALIDELESTRAEVARLSREAGIAEERQRLAGDIHDTIAQGLSSVVMLAQAADAALVTDPEAARRHLAMAARTARENLEEARAIVGALTPTPLADASAVEAIRRLMDRLRGETGIDVEFAVEGQRRTLPTVVEVVLLRVAQEALNNVRKHSAATEASLRIGFTEKSVVLEVSDNGCGFQPAHLPAGYGLGSMRTRVGQVGGQLRVRSAPGEGTTVRTELEA